MADQGSVWQRLGSMIRGAPRDEPTRAEVERLETAAPAPLERADRRIPWWKRRALRHAQAREVSRRIVELANVMHEHLKRQEERHGEVGVALQRLGTLLETVTTQQKNTADTLRSVADSAALTGKHSAVISDAVSRIPDSMLSQADAVRKLSQRIELAQESDTQLHHALQQFQRSVEKLSASDGSRAEALQQLHSAHERHHDALRALIREQSRRFLVIILIVGIVVVAALAALGTTLALSLQR
ncbi:MAG: hypothetical protein IPM18_04090 [Phycisphaerales bacterium]|nr:hypothetical protein [Phycisphaerales bacterium]